MAGNSGSAERPAQLQAAPSLTQLKEGLLFSYVQCSERGLIHSANWWEEIWCPQSGSQTRGVMQTRSLVKIQEHY